MLFTDPDGMRMGNPDGKSAQGPSATPTADSSSGADALFNAVYDRLKAMVGKQRRSWGGAETLNTTALVNELYLRVCAGREIRFEHPAQFFSYAARALRHLLSDQARNRLRVRAGGDWVKVSLSAADEDAVIVDAEEALAIDDMLEQLEAAEPRAARVVQLRYFAGLTLEQIAQVLDVHRTTVDRDWRFARAFLHSQLI